MKHFTKFIAVAIMALMSINYVWADYTVSLNGEETGLSNAGTFSSTTQNGVTVSADKNGGTQTAYYTTGDAVRFYAKNKMTVSFGSAMTQIVINYGSKSNAITSASVGSIGTYNGTAKTQTWTGSATSVTFTFGGTKGNDQITSVVVTAGSSTYTLVYAANGGSGTMTDSNSPYEAGASVTLLANTFTAPTGKRWDSWKVTDASSNNVTVTDGKITMPASNVTVTAQWVDACSRSITISKGSESNGTFTLGTTGSVCIDGGNASTTVTCSPNAHYHVREVTSTGGGTVTGSGNSWTVSNISANTTINVTFEEDTKYTVIFKNAGTQVSSKQVYANEAIGALLEKGTMESCDNSSTTFMGWTTQTISEKTSDEPTYVTAETVVDHDNFVVNAVWAREE